MWGGFDGVNYFNTGGRYNPATNSWVAGGTSMTNAPSARRVWGPIWTGSEMIVWGGYDGVQVVNTGGRYDPATNAWRATSTSGAPSARTAHTGVWTGGDMIVWSGIPSDNTGGVYGASGGSTDVEDGSAAASAVRLVLAPPSPNPSTGLVTLAYQLSVGGPIRLSVHDVSGREIAQLRAGESPAGWHSITWDGTGSAGHRVNAGVYYVRAIGEGISRTQQLVILR
ncbi:MAG: FlgD immunoglobulin-like domain containing protein [Candidatus Eisenbacteria bacterium]